MSSTYAIPAGTADGTALTVTDSATLAASTIVGTLDAGSSGLAGVDVIRVSAGAFTLGVRTIVAGSVTSASATFTYHVHDDDFDASDVLRIHDLAASGSLSAGPGGAPGMTQRGAHNSTATYAPGDVVTDAGGLYVNTAAVVPDTRADTFDRPDQSAWGTASGGHVWSYGYQGDSTEALASHHGQQVAGASHDASFLLAGPALTEANAEILVSWSIATGSSSTNGLVLNIRGDRDANVRAQLVVRLNGSSRLQQIGLDPLPDDVTASWAGATTGDQLWTRLRAVGFPGTYQWRTWADGDAEPASWDGTVLAGAFLDGRSVLVAGEIEATGDTLQLHYFNATTSFLAPADDPAHWAPLGPHRRGAHDPAATYAAGALVTDGGGLYQAVAAVVPDTRSDTFARADQDGWGTASDGHVWDALPTGGLGDTPRGVDALVSSAGRQTSDSFYTYGEDTLLLGAALTGADFDMLVRWKIVTQSAPDKVTPSLLFAVSDDGSDYTGFHIDSSGIGSNFLGDAHPWKGVAYAGNGWGTFDDDTWYWTRLRVQGAVYRLRTWADGDDEPSIWHFTLTAEGAPPAGRVGLQSIAAESGAVMAYDSFRVTTSFLAPADDPAHWQALAPAPAQSGVPVLYGPYIVDFGDILHDGDTKVLWTPQVGDVILRVFPDVQTVVQWDQGYLYVGQGTPGHDGDFLCMSVPNGIGTGNGGDTLDSVDASAHDQAHFGGHPLSTVFICHTTEPIRIAFAQLGGTDDPTQGHVELYALVARAVAP